MSYLYLIIPLKISLNRAKVLYILYQIIYSYAWLKNIKDEVIFMNGGPRGTLRSPPMTLLANVACLSFLPLY